MRSKKISRIFYFTALNLFLICSAQDTRGDIVVVNFDSLDTSTSSVTGSALDSYLAGYGITISNVSPSGYPEVYSENSSGGFWPGYATASSGTNFLAHGDGVPGGNFNYINNPISFRLNFSTLLNSFEFTRIQIDGRPSPSGIVLAGWQARALNSSGTTIATVGEGQFGSYGIIAAKTFTLNGPNIKSVVIERNYTNTYAGTNTVLIDDFKLNAVPEPTGLAMLCPLLGGIAALRRRRTETATK